MIPKLIKAGTEIVVVVLAIVALCLQAFWDWLWGNDWDLKGRM